MNIIVFIIKNITLYDYVLLLGVVCMAYFLISPILYRIWIIPKIENRYGRWLRINSDDYPYVPFASWFMPPLELSLYIMCKYTRCELPGVKKPWKNTLTSKLKEVNYDVTKASNSEIVMCFITVFTFLYFFIVIGGLCLWDSYLK